MSPRDIVIPNSHTAALFDAYHPGWQRLVDDIGVTPIDSPPLLSPSKRPAASSGTDAVGRDDIPPGQPGYPCFARPSGSWLPTDGGGPVFENDALGEAC